MPLYTPFLKESVDTVGQGYGQNVVGNLMQKAYLGDDNAMSELARYSPQAVQQIQQQRMQQQQAQIAMQAKQAETKKATQEWAMQNKQLIDGVMKGAAQLPDFQSAQQYINTELNNYKQMGVQIPDQFSAETFTPQAFDQIKKIYPTPTKTVGKNDRLVGPDNKVVLDAEPESGSKVAMQAINPQTGDIIPIQHDSKSGQYADNKGQPFSLPPGYVITHVAAPQGAIEGIVPKGLDAQIRQKAGSVISFNDTAQKVADLIKSNPDITTLTAGAASLANTAKAEAQAIGRFMGIDTDVYTPSQYNDTFRELGIKSDVLKSLYTSLAFQAAAASGQSGKDVSNKDVERFLKQVGGGGSDPMAVLRVLQSTTNTINDSFQNEHKQLYKGKEYPGDLHKPTFPDFGKNTQWEIVK